MPLIALLLMAAMLHPAPEPEPIRISSIGYATGCVKQASIMGKAERFDVIDHKNSAVVFSAPLTGPLECPDTDEKAYLADFTTFDQPGFYDLVVPGLDKAPHSFSISRDCYNPPLTMAMAAFSAWRCGSEVTLRHQGLTYHHMACHLQDGLLDCLGQPGQVKRAVGGWHDAGDYNKYVVNAGITLGCLLQAWQRFQPVLQALTLPIPEHGKGLPDYLAELKWELDWMLAMQMPDGSVSAKLSARRFDAFELPEDDSAPRYFSPVGSAATADFVASLAQASRAFAPYDAAYAMALRQAAARGREWLRKHPEDLLPDFADFKTGAYKTEDPDDRLWAAAEWWELCGDQAALHELELKIRQQGALAEQDWDWSKVKNLGLLCYALSDRQGRDAALLAQVRAGIVGAADSIVAHARSHGFGRGMSAHYWGSNGSVARLSLLLMSADALAPRHEYRDTVALQLSYLYGRNHYGRSQVTGQGYHPPMNPHHRPSGSDGIEAPWPGYLVGGGTTGINWEDEQRSYSTNEVAINWNAALVYALAAAASH